MVTYPQFYQGQPSSGGGGAQASKERAYMFLDQAIRGVFGYLDTKQQRDIEQSRWQQNYDLQNQQVQERIGSNQRREQLGALGAAAQGTSPEALQGIYGQRLGAMGQPAQPTAQEQYALYAPIPRTAGSTRPSPPAVQSQALGQLPSPLESVYQQGVESRGRAALAGGLGGLSEAGEKTRPQLSKDRNIEASIQSVTGEYESRVAANPEFEPQYRKRKDDIIAALRKASSGFDDIDKAAEKKARAGRAIPRPTQVSNLETLLANSPDLRSYQNATRYLSGAPTFTSEDQYQGVREEAISRVGAKSVGQYANAESQFARSNNPAGLRDLYIGAMGLTEDEADRKVRAVMAAGAAVRGEKTGQIDAASADRRVGALERSIVSMTRLASDPISGTPEVKADLARMQGELETVKAQAQEARTRKPPQTELPPAAGPVKEADREAKQAEVVHRLKGTAAAWRREQGGGTEQKANAANRLKPWRAVFKSSPEKFRALYDLQLTPEVRAMLEYIEAHPEDRAYGLQKKQPQKAKRPLSTSPKGRGDSRPSSTRKAD
jgi:hypothetical protein